MAMQSAQEEKSDNEIIKGIFAECTSNLNPYAPLARRLNQIYKKIDRRVQQEKHN